MDARVESLDFYNKDIKLRYLERYEGDSQLTIAYTLTKATSTERSLNKDLASFNDKEISLVMHNINPRNLDSSKRSGGIIAKYIDWAAEHGYRPGGNINPLSGLGDEFYKNFVGHKKMLFSDTEINEITDQLVNYQDKLTIQLAFEGIMGEELYEMRTLKMSSIVNENTLSIMEQGEEPRLIKVSDKLIELMEKANDENVYLYKNGFAEGKNREGKLVRNEYILRKPLRGDQQNSPDPINTSVLYYRLRSVGNFTDNPQLSFNNLKKSGLIKKAVELYKEHGKLESEEFSQLGEWYNVSSQLASNGVLYPNLTVVKSTVTRDAILNLYGIDIEK